MPDDGLNWKPIKAAKPAPPTNDGLNWKPIHWPDQKQLVKLGLAAPREDDSPSFFDGALNVAGNVAGGVGRGLAAGAENVVGATDILIGGVPATVGGWFGHPEWGDRFFQASDALRGNAHNLVSGAHGTGGKLAANITSGIVQYAQPEIGAITSGINAAAGDLQHGRSLGQAYADFGLQTAIGEAIGRGPRRAMSLDKKIATGLTVGAAAPLARHLGEHYLVGKENVSPLPTADETAQSALIFGALPALHHGAMRLLGRAPAGPIPTREKMDDILSGVGKQPREKAGPSWEDVFHNAGKRGGRSGATPETVQINPAELPAPRTPRENANPSARTGPTGGEVAHNAAPASSARGTPTYAANWQAARQELHERAQHPSDALNGPDAMRSLMELAKRHGISLKDLESATPPPITQTGESAPAPSAPETADTATDDGLQWHKIPEGTDKNTTSARALDSFDALRRKQAAGKKLTPEENDALLEGYARDRDTARVTGSGKRMRGVGTMDALATREQSGSAPTVYGFIDADNFKAINDSLGHGAGDQAIADIGNALVRAYGAGNVFHKGGDEFVVTGDDAGRMQSAHQKAEKALEATTLTDADGDKYTRRIGISAGFGDSIGAADKANAAQKDARLAAGKRTKRAPHQADTSQHPVVEVALGEIKNAPDVPQFKHGADKNGVVKPIPGKVDRRGMGPVQLWRRNDGELQLISGRHRVHKFRQEGETKIPAQIYNEADGFDAEQARLHDALMNIRDGQGDVADYVQFFQRPAFEGEQGKQYAEREGYLRSRTGEKAYALGRQGVPELIAAHRAGALSDETAVQIAQAAPNNEDLQNLGMKLVGEGKPIGVATNAMRAAKTVAGNKADQGDIFGFNDAAIQNLVKMSRAAFDKQRELSEQIAAVQGAAKRPEKAKALGVDVKDPEDVKRKIVELKAERDRWQHWDTSPELTDHVRAMAGLDRAPAEPRPEQEPEPQAGQQEPAPESASTPPSTGEMGSQDGSFTLKMETAPAPAPAPSAPPSGDMFGAPTSQEKNRAATKDKDAKRNGLDREGRKDIHAGDGELFEGARPKQADITKPQPTHKTAGDARAAAIRDGLKPGQFHVNKDDGGWIVVRKPILSESGEIQGGGDETPESTGETLEMPAGGWDGWWDHELTNAGRREAMVEAGVRRDGGSAYPPAIRWRHLTMNGHAALQEWWRQRAKGESTPAPAPSPDDFMRNHLTFVNASDSASRKPASAPTPRTNASVPSASREIAGMVQERLEQGEAVSAKELFKAADAAFGGTMAEGAYTPKDAYDAMEMGVNLHIMANPKRFTPNTDAGYAVRTIQELQRLADRLPTQTKRTGETDEFQQFSTHPGFAFLANWAANPKSSDMVLEPSAGVGGLAAFAKLAGAKVETNELSPRRAKLLGELGFHPTTENAEQLHNILSDSVKPTLVVMNPPFSATAGRMHGKRDTMVGAAHIEQALKRLEPSGRLVAIVGNGMAADKPRFRPWWDKIKQKYTVRANIGLPGTEYRKYGTDFDNQLLVIDKTGPTETQPVTGAVDTLTDAVPLLKEIRNDRPDVDTSSQPESREPQRPQGSGSGARAEREPGDVVPESASVVDHGESGDGEGAARRPASPVGASIDDGAPGERGAGAADSSRAPAEIEPERPADSDGGDAQPKPADEGGERVPERDDRLHSELSVGSHEPGAEPVEHEASVDSIYESYTPQRLSIPGAQPHPGKLVQSAAMAAVLPPEPTYTPNLPKSVVEDGKLSLPQLEAIVYAGQAHSQHLEDGARRGFFVGDGTGVGKGREIAGIMLDNLRSGRNNAVWVSKSAGLLADAQRDIVGVGGNKKDVFAHADAAKATAKIPTDKKGILFTTYAMLRSSAKITKGETSAFEGAEPQRRIDQLIDWLGEDFDGVIAFDEAHNMGNATGKTGSRGKTKPSQQALAGLELQKRLKNARVVYVSATGATDVSNLAYATRLGLWGPGTAFTSTSNFIDQISNGGLAAMELVSRDMKQSGQYMARSLSFDGVTYERIEHQLTDFQTDVYNELAKAWRVVLANINEALEMTGVVGDHATNGKAKGAALSRFWGTQQRFFNQVLTAMQMPTVLEQAAEDLEQGRSVVFQIVNTNEAAQERAIAGMSVDESMEELDLTPRDALLEYVRNGYPVRQYVEASDDNGNIISVPAKDSNGKPVTNKEAVAARDALVKNLENIRVPDGPLEMILDTFGVDNTAEITGRKKRVVRTRGKDGHMRRALQKRSAKSVHADANDFQAGKKHVLAFSDAGGTGFSFHAGLDAKNQERRVHYLIQAGWRADNAIQGFGRTHRSNEASQPIYKLAMTNLPAHKRFISSIARRLDQLGALTKGQRDASSAGMMKAEDNLEGPYAADAVKRVFEDMYHGKAQWLDWNKTTQDMGFDNLLDSAGALNETKIPTVPKFLNRLMSVDTHDQGAIFDAFMARLEANVQLAIQNGTMDTGMQTVTSLNTKVVSDQLVHTDESTGAETHYVELTLEQPVHVEPFPSGERVSYVHNTKSGKLWAVKDAGTRTASNGVIHDRVYLVSPTSARVEDKVKLEGKNWQSVDAASARELWDQAVDAAPKTRTEDMHIITGALLPIWDRLRGNVHVVRVMTNGGDRYLGRQIQPFDLRDTLRALGASSSASSMSPADVQKAVMGAKKKMELANGWILERRKVNNEPRMEIARFPEYDYAAKRALEAMGGFFERIQFQERAFIPTGDKGRDVLTALLKQHPVIGDIQDPSRDDFAGPDGSMDLHSEGASYGDARNLPNTGRRDEAVAQQAHGHMQPTGRLRNLTAYAEQRGGLAPLLRSRAELKKYASQVQVGTFKSGIDKVANWRDAAHVIAAIRKYPQEHSVALVTDAERRPIAVLMHSIGTNNTTPVHLAAFAGSVMQVPGAKEVWFAHNHPPGMIDQSADDRAMTDRMGRLLRGTGVRYRGMIVVAPGARRASYYAGRHGEGSTNFGIPIPAHARYLDVPVLERVYRKVLPAVEHGRKVNAVNVVDFVHDYGDRTGLMLFDNYLHSVGFLPMAEPEMGRLQTGNAQTGAADALRAIAESNANHVIPVVTDTRTGTNVGSFLAAANMPAPDIALLRGDGTVDTFLGAGLDMERDAYLSVGDGKGGIGDQLEDVVDEVTSHWHNGPDVFIRETPQELPDAAKRVSGWEKAEGYYDGQNVYLVRSMLASPERVREVLAHEAISHYGVDRIVDDYAPGGWKRVTDEIAAMRRAPERQSEKMQVVLAETERRYEGANDAKFAKEALGVMGEHGIKSGLMARVWQAIRRFLRKFIPSLRFTHADLMGMLGRANEYVHRQGVYRPVGETEPAFSRTIDTQARYDQRIDELFDGDPANRRGIKVLDRADILDLLGNGDKPLHLVESEVSKGRFNHGLTEADWKRVPEWVEHPVAAFKSDTVPGRIVLFGPELVDGKPVLIALDPEHGMAGMDVHVLVNPFDKDHPETIPVQRWLREHKLVYLNQKLSPAFSERSGLQLPRDVRQLRGYKHRVLTEQDLIKYRADNPMPGLPVDEGVGPLLSTRPEDMTEAQAAAMGKMGGHPGTMPIKQRVQRLTERAGERLARGIVDQFAPLKRVDETAYMQARLSRGTDGALEAVFLYGTPYLRDGAIDIKPDGTGFRGILSGLNGEGERFLAWIAGNRSYALSQEWVVKRDGKVVGRYKNKAAANTAALKMLDESRRQASMVPGARMPRFTAQAAPREFLFNDDEIDALRKLNQGTMHDGRSRTAAYAKAHSEFKRYQKAVLDIAQEAGLIDPESRKIWESEFYIPFYRALEADNKIGYGGTSAGMLRQRAIRELKGGNHPLQDLLYNVLANWSMMLTATMRNMAGARALREATKQHIATRLTGPESGSVWIMERGKQIHYLVHDPLVLDALESLSYDGLKGPFWDVMRTFKHALTVGVTNSPVFRVKNLIRDTTSTLAISGDAGWNPVANIVNGFTATKHGSDTDIRLLAGGGKIRFGSMMDSNQARHAKQLINAGVRDSQVLDSRKKVAAAMRIAWDWWQEVGDRSESINRAVLYNRNYARTGNHLLASYEARDLLDFTMTGAWMPVRMFTNTVSFVNARMQGVYKLGRAATHHPLRAAAVVGMVAMASALNYLMNRNDPEYRALPDYIRNNYWVVRLGPQFVFIPKPFEIGALGSVVERGTELATSGDDYQAQDFARSLAEILMSQLAMNPIPQAIKPGLEAAFNYNMFRGHGIDTESELNRPAGTRYTPYTSAGAIALGKTVNVSPKRIQHMVRGYFGWLGLQALDVTDLMLHGAMGLSVSPDRDMSKLKNIPMLSKFIRESDSMSSKYMDRFYRSQKNIEQVYQGARFEASQGNLEHAREMFTDPRVGLHDLYYKDARAFGKLRSRIRAIAASDEMSAAEKDKLITQIRDTMNQIAKKADQVKRKVLH